MAFFCTGQRRQDNPSLQTQGTLNRARASLVRYTDQLSLSQIGEVVTTIPTIGFNVESVNYKNLNFNVWVCALTRLSLCSTNLTTYNRIWEARHRFARIGGVTMQTQPL